MATQSNPVSTNSQIRELTQGEVDHFFHEVIDRVNDQLSPGKLVSNKKNLEALFKSADQHMVKITWTLLQTFQYQQAVRTLTNVFMQAVKHIMFDLPSPLEWSAPHPAITKRRALEAEQSGKVKPLTDQEGRTKITAQAEKAKEAAAFDKQEKQYEKNVSVLIDKVFFINPRSQQRDERKIQDLQQELHDVVAKARRNGKAWGEIHAVVARRINDVYREDERARERWNSR